MRFQQPDSTKPGAHHMPGRFIQVAARATKLIAQEANKKAKVNRKLRLLLCR